MRLERRTDHEMPSLRRHKAIRDAAGPRLQVIIDFAYFTGQRISDVLKIRRTDLTDSGTTFAQSKTGTKLTVAWSDGLRVLAPQ